eukprot:IDg23610t1
MPRNTRSSSAAPPPPDLTSAQAFSRFSRIKVMTESIQHEDEFFSCYLNIARSVLAIYDVPHSTGTTPYLLPPSPHVREAMSDMLPALPEIYKDDFYTRPMYPIKALFNVAKFYRFETLDDEFTAALNLSDHEKSDRSIMTQAWFANLAGADADTTRTIIDSFKNKRSILTHRPPSAPVVDTRQVDPQRPPLGPGPGPFRRTPLEPGSSMSHAAPPPRPSTVASGVHKDHPQREHAATHRVDDVTAHLSDMQIERLRRSEVKQGQVDTRKANYVAPADVGTESDYFANTLDGAARNFLLSHFTPGIPYEQLECLMKTEYDSDSRQLQMVEKIHRLTPQCPAGFRADENKLRFLRSAVISHDWALAPIRNIVTHRYKFNAFVTALHESLQLNVELKNRSSPSSTLLVEDHDDEFYGTHFQQYGRNPHDVRKYGYRGARFTRGGRRGRGGRFMRTRGSRRSKTFSEAQQRNECYKCGEQNWDPRHVCAPGAIRENVRGRLRQGHTHVHIVSDFVLGLEADNATQGMPTQEDSTMEGAQNTQAVNYTEDRVHEFDDALEASGMGAMAEAEFADAVDAHLVDATISAASGVNGTGPGFQVDCSSIFTTDLRREYRASRPVGFCVDIGAPKSVAGKKELHRILSAMKMRDYRLKPSQNKFRFGDDTFSSLGVVTLPLPTPNGVKPIHVDFDIVLADVPALLGMDILDREELIADTVFNKLARREQVPCKDGTVAYVDVWSMPLERSRSGHVYLSVESCNTSHFTR